MIEGQYLVRESDDHGLEVLLTCSKKIFCKVFFKIGNKYRSTKGIEFDTLEEAINFIQADCDGKITRATIPCPAPAAVLTGEVMA